MTNPGDISMSNSIHEFSFIEFVMKLEQAVKQGYTVDYTDNVPSNFGPEFRANLLKEEKPVAKKKTEKE